MRLTARQRDVVALLDAGMNCPEIAQRLRIAITTVRRHVRDIAAKLPGTPDVPALRLVRRHAAELLEAA